MRYNCHLSGKSSGSAHDVGDLRYKVRTFFSVVFQNLCCYASRLFTKTLGSTDGDTSVILNDEENYISFAKQVVVDKF